MANGAATLSSSNRTHFPARPPKPWRRRTSEPTLTANGHELTRNRGKPRRTADGRRFTQIMSASIAFTGSFRPQISGWSSSSSLVKSVSDRNTPNLGQYFPGLNRATHLICVNLRASAVRLGFFLYSCQFVSIRGFSLCLC